MEGGDPSPVLVMPHPEHLSPFLCSLLQKTQEHTGKSPVKDHKVIKELGHLWYEERPEELELFSLEKGRLRDHRSVYKHLKGRYKGDKARQTLFSGAQRQDERQWTQFEAHDLPYEYQEMSFSLWEWLNVGISVTEMLWSLHPYKYSKAIWTWSWAACSRCLFQSWPFCDSSSRLGIFGTLGHHHVKSAECLLPLTFAFLPVKLWKDLPIYCR